MMFNEGLTSLAISTKAYEMSAPPMKSFAISEGHKAHEILDAKAHKRHHVDFHFGKIYQKVNFIQDSRHRERVKDAPPGDFFFTLLPSSK